MKAVAIALPTDLNGVDMEVGSKVIVTIRSAHGEPKILNTYEAEMVLHQYSICTKHHHNGVDHITPMISYSSNVSFTVV